MKREACLVYNCEMKQNPTALTENYAWATLSFYRTGVNCVHRLLSIQVFYFLRSSDKSFVRE